jgi:hypothetical protein
MGGGRLSVHFLESGLHFRVVVANINPGKMIKIATRNKKIF